MKGYLVGNINNVEVDTGLWQFGHSGILGQEVLMFRRQKRMATDQQLVPLLPPA